MEPHVGTAQRIDPTSDDTSGSGQLFASRSVSVHLARGAIGLSALSASVAVLSDHPLVAVALVPIGLLALRGCPGCWTIGLIQTIAMKLGARRRASNCTDARCSLSPSRGNREDEQN